MPRWHCKCDLSTLNCQLAYTLPFNQMLRPRLTHGHPQEGRETLARTVGRPSELAAAGRLTQQSLKAVSALARDAPRKARALLHEQLAVAPEATGQGNITAKSKAATDAIFSLSGGINETIAVCGHDPSQQSLPHCLPHC